MRTPRVFLFVVFAFAMLVVATFTRRASAHPGVVNSEYQGSGHGCSAGIAGGSYAGCHTGTGSSGVALSAPSGGAAANVGGRWYVDPGAWLDFTVTVTASAPRTAKGINGFNRTGNQGQFATSDAHLTGTTDPAGGGPPYPEVTFSSAVIVDGTATFSFRWQAPSGLCLDTGVAVWGNATDPTSFSSQVTGNAPGFDQIFISTRCGSGTDCSASGTICANGQCWDNVCCDRSCGGTCDSCTGGTCVATSGPTRGRSCSGSGVCQGQCLGGDNCTPSTAACAGGTCSSGTALPTVFCSGGSCPTPTATACAPFACNAAGTACNGSCTLDTDCASGNFCSGGACVSQLPPGGACTAKNQCLSGICVDGVCCTSNCTEQCGACNLPGKEGTCSAVTGAPVGGRAACATDGSVCGGACDGATLAACAYPTTSCRTADCSGGVETQAASCDGKGACPLATTKVCAPYACKGTACGASCTTDADCATGDWCQAGACVPKSTVGTSCGDARECTSGNCIDFVCCDRPCGSSCEACDVTGHVGTCSTVTGPPHGSRTCPAGPDGCPGTCSGASPSCSVGSCDAGADGATEGGTDGATEGGDATLGDASTDAVDESGGDGSIGGDTGTVTETPEAGDAGTDQPNENGGCACRTTSSSGGGGGGEALACLALGAWAVVARRRRAR